MPSSAVQVPVPSESSTSWTTLSASSPRRGRLLEGSVSRQMETPINTKKFEDCVDESGISMDLRRVEAEEHDFPG